MISSGLSPLSTHDDEPVALLAFKPSYAASSVCIVNEGPEAGFFSIDDGATWARLPARDRISVPANRGSSAPPLLVRRTPGGTDLSGLYAWGI